MGSCFRGWRKGAGQRDDRDSGWGCRSGWGTARGAGSLLAVPGRRFGLIFRLFCVSWWAVDSWAKVNLLVTVVGLAACLGPVGIEVPQDGRQPILRFIPRGFGSANASCTLRPPERSPAQSSPASISQKDAKGTKNLVVWKPSGFQPCSRSLWLAWLVRPGAIQRT